MGDNNKFVSKDNITNLLKSTKEYIDKLDKNNSDKTSELESAINDLKKEIDAINSILLFKLVENQNDIE